MLLLQVLTLADRLLVKYHKVEWWLKHMLRCLCKTVVTCFIQFSKFLLQKKYFQGSPFQSIYESIFQSVPRFSHVLQSSAIAYVLVYCVCIVVCVLCLYCSVCIVLHFSKSLEICHVGCQNGLFDIILLTLNKLKDAYTAFMYRLHIHGKYVG